MAPACPPACLPSCMPAFERGNASVVVLFLRIFVFVFLMFFFPFAPLCCDMFCFVSVVVLLLVCACFCLLAYLHFVVGLFTACLCVFLLPKPYSTSRRDTALSIPLVISKTRTRCPCTLAPPGSTLGSVLLHVYFTCTSLLIFLLIFFHFFFFSHFFAFRRKNFVRFEFLLRHPRNKRLFISLQVDDQKRHRYDVADVLRDVSRILGGVPCLRQLVAILEQEVNIFLVGYLVFAVLILSSDGK